MHLRRLFTTMGDGGDTIVEVLIAIAVISVVLVGAYATTNHSLRSTEDAQERSNATSLVESQLELLKTASSTDPYAIWNRGAALKTFCLTEPDSHGSFGASIYPSSNSNCNVNTTGTPTTVQPDFNLSITNPITGSNPQDTFIVEAQWPSVEDNVTDNVQIVYRVYEN